MNLTRLLQPMRPAAALLLALALLAAGLPGSAQAAGEPGLTTALTFADGSYPTALANGPGGAMWFTLGKADIVGRLDSSGVWTPLATLEPGAYPFDITLGPDAAMWFTERAGGKIGRMDAGGGLSEFALDNPGAYPSQIVAGQDGGVWFTEFHNNRIGRIGLDGTIDEYLLPHPDSRPLGIASDLQGNLWFTQWNGKRIGMIDPYGVISEYEIPGVTYRPTEIVLGGDGNLWFVFEISDYLARLDPSSGAITTYHTTMPGSILDLAAGPDGRLWLITDRAVAHWFNLKASGPELEDNEVISPQWVFSGEGRSQIAAGPGGDMFMILANQQTVSRYGMSDGSGHDLQTIINPLPETMLISGEFEVDIDVINWSLATAGSARLVVDLPPGAHFVNAAYGPLSCDDLGTQVSCLVGDLASGARHSSALFFRFDRLYDEAVTGRLAVTASSSALDPLPANNRAFRDLEFLRVLEYFNDFSTAAGSRWSAETVTTLGSLKYLGPFDNQAVTLTFDNLPHHDRVDVCFDLYVLGGWDGSSLVDPAPGSSEVIGPDLWSDYIDESINHVTTFSNQDLLSQSYPAEYNEGTFPAQTRAAETGDFNGDGKPNDSRYRICETNVHARALLEYTFHGANLNGSSGERWALDNVSVRIYYRAVYDWLFLPLLAK